MIYYYIEIDKNTFIFCYLFIHIYIFDTSVYTEYIVFLLENKIESQLMV